MIEFDFALREALTEKEIPFTDEMIMAAVDYASYLLEENQKMNLTAILEEHDVAVKHFADSLCLLKYAEIPQGASLLDVGSGAGFPGMVLKIFRPDLKIILLDSLKKRCGFLERLAAELSISDIRVLWGRAEELAKDAAYREQFDFVTARAVASLPILLEYCTPFLKQEGMFLAMKAKAEPENPEYALSELNCEIGDTVNYDLEGDERTLIKIKKIGTTSEKYPRRAGMPEKRPLIKK